MNGSTLGFGDILNIVGIILAVVFTIASLYQNSLSRHTQEQQPEQTQILPVLKTTLGIAGLDVLATILVILIIKYGFFSFIIWLNNDANGMLYISIFSAILVVTVTIYIFIRKGRKNH